MKKILIFLFFTVIYALEDYDDDYRKHYGLSFHKRCRNYVKTFKCMTACKSVGYQVFRLDNRCKCTCHEMKTTTILPFFKWRTNGTTRKVPKTQSPNLYHVVGTLSPATFDDSNETETPSTTTASRCPTLKPHPSSAKTSSTKSTDPLREKETTPGKGEHSTTPAKSDTTVNINATDNVKGDTNTTGDGIGNTTVSGSTAHGEGINSTATAGTGTGDHAAPGASTAVDNAAGTGAATGAGTGGNTDDAGAGGGTGSVTGGNTVPAANNEHTTSANVALL